MERQIRKGLVEWFISETTSLNVQIEGLDGVSQFVKHFSSWVFMRGDGGRSIHHVQVDDNEI